VPLHSHVNEQITQVISGTIRFWFGANKEQVFEPESWADFEHKHH